MCKACASMGWRPRDPWVMGHMGHGSRAQWVTWVMGHSDWPIPCSVACPIPQGDHKNCAVTQLPTITSPNCQCAATHRRLFITVLRSRCGHYMFVLFFSSSSSFLAKSQLLQTGCLPYFSTWCGLGASLKCMSEMCCTRLDENTGRKKLPKIAIWAPSHKFVRLYLRN